MNQHPEVIRENAAMLALDHAFNHAKTRLDLPREAIRIALKFVSVE